MTVGGNPSEGRGIPRGLGFPSAPLPQSSKGGDMQRVEVSLLSSYWWPLSSATQLGMPMSGKSIKQRPMSGNRLTARVIPIWRYMAVRMDFVDNSFK